jgi:hypothetical protein
MQIGKGVLLLKRMKIFMEAMLQVFVAAGSGPTAPRGGTFDVDPHFIPSAPVTDVVH